MPRALRASAISRSVVAPALRTSLITGTTLAACRSAAVFKAWTACLRAVASYGPPSFTPRALAVKLRNWRALREAPTVA
jgi:hypothetical protein